ncbi:MAG: hypothetical protein EBZ48_10750 [Proteobacteria bacterium]|nr:hypothetical protein [Pseudomonadota bacterium]
MNGISSGCVAGSPQRTSTEAVISAGVDDVALKVGCCSELVKSFLSMVVILHSILAHRDELSHTNIPAD